MWLLLLLFTNHVANCQYPLATFPAYDMSFWGGNDSSVPPPTRRTSLTKFLVDIQDMSLTPQQWAIDTINGFIGTLSPITNPSVSFVAIARGYVNIIPAYDWQVTHRLLGSTASIDAGAAALEAQQYSRFDIASTGRSLQFTWNDPRIISSYFTLELTGSFAELQSLTKTIGRNIFAVPMEESATEIMEDLVAFQLWAMRVSICDGCVTQGTGTVIIKWFLKANPTFTRVQEQMNAAHRNISAQSGSSYTLARSWYNQQVTFTVGSITEITTTTTTSTPPAPIAWIVWIIILILILTLINGVFCVYTRYYYKNQNKYGKVPVEERYIVNSDVNRPIKM